MLYLAAAILAQAVASPPPPRLARMAELFAQTCLSAFPDDMALDRLMATKGATVLTPEQVKVTLRDDPGRGWLLKEGDVTVQIMLELPPYHACSVRFPMPGGDLNLAPYRAVVDPFEREQGGWAVSRPFESDMDGLHIHSTGDRRDTAGGGRESLFVIDQHVTDAKRRAAGETGIMLRFVRQIVAPGAR